MPTLGVQELLIILLIVLVIFGASKLPKLGRGLGEGIRNFKKGLSSEEEEPTEKLSDSGSGSNS
ncbi:MAG: twin-arginine translocase TatA/TatE family subunit [Thermoanaerobaculia bacterium]|nr:twin-arginine translocase TatA/TatE family subunit [Thermoanaerobaculia bacterium]